MGTPIAAAAGQASAPLFQPLLGKEADSESRWQKLFPGDLPRELRHNFLRDGTWAYISALNTDILFHTSQALDSTASIQSQITSASFTQPMTAQWALGTVPMFLLATGETAYRVSKGEKLTSKELGQIWAPTIAASAAIPMWNLAQVIGNHIGTTGADAGLWHGASMAGGLIAAPFTGVFEGATQWGVKYAIDLVTNPVKQKMWKKDKKLMGKLLAKELVLNTTIGAIPGAVWQIVFFLVLASLVGGPLGLIGGTIITALIVGIAVMICNFGCKHAINWASTSIDKALGWDKEYEKLMATVQLNPVERENRIRDGEGADADIQKRLKKESERAKTQMDEESQIKAPLNLPAFSHKAAPDDFEAQSERLVIDGYQVGISHIQGPRESMEDEHVASSCTITIDGKEYPMQVFGIFDGHGGDQCAKYVKDNLQEKLQETLIEFNPAGLTDVGIWNALKIACVRLNEDFKTKEMDSGSTGAIVVILDGKLWAINVGDSRIMIDNNGIPIQMSTDAKPEDPYFQQGVRNRGGDVTMGDGALRVNGMIAVARSFGDICVEGAMSARPKITMIPLQQLNPNFQLLITCDGLTDVASTRQLTRTCYEHREDPQDKLARDLVYSTSKSGSMDNQSAMVIRSPTFQTVKQVVRRPEQCVIS